MLLHFILLEFYKVGIIILILKMRKSRLSFGGKVLNIIHSNIPVFLFVINPVSVFFKKSFSTLRSKIYSPKFSSKSFNFFLTCKTLIHLGLTLTRGTFDLIPYGQLFYFQLYLVKSFSFLFWRILPALTYSVIHMCIHTMRYSTAGQSSLHAAIWMNPCNMWWTNEESVSRTKKCDESNSVHLRS